MPGHPPIRIDPVGNFVRSRSPLAAFTGAIASRYASISIPSSVRPRHMRTGTTVSLIRVVLRQGLSLGEFIGSLWGVHVYARDFGKNEIALARYLRGVGFKLCNVPTKSCSLESEVGFKALQRI